MLNVSSGEKLSFLDPREIFPFIIRVFIFLGMPRLHKFLHTSDGRNDLLLLRVVLSLRIFAAHAGLAFIAPGDPRLF